MSSSQDPSTSHENTRPPKIPKNPFGKLKIVHINLNHCIAANETLKDFLANVDADVALLQGAHTVEGKLNGFPWPVFSSKAGSAHLVIRNTNITYSHLYTGDHCVFITITAKEGHLIVGTTYAAPSINFKDSLEEWKHLITHRRYFICSGDFNAQSPLWGYAKENPRGEVLTKHLIEHNLAIANLDNTVHTFVKTDSKGRVVAKGFPDHTLVNPLANTKIRNWHVSDVYTASDHKYIVFDFDITPEHTERRRFNTTRGNLRKFTHIIKTHKPLLKKTPG